MVAEVAGRVDDEGHVLAIDEHVSSFVSRDRVGVGTAIHALGDVVAGIDLVVAGEGEDVVVPSPGSISFGSPVPVSVSSNWLPITFSNAGPVRSVPSGAAMRSTPAPPVSWSVVSPRSMVTGPVGPGQADRVSIAEAVDQDVVPTQADQGVGSVDAQNVAT